MSRSRYGRAVWLVENGGSAMAYNSGRFRFDGGAATYLGTGILAMLVTVFTLGICYPSALVLRERRH
jgi:uncharacterized membrane protein YjgN (DUF898 family)